MKIRCDIFGMLETENGKVTKQEYKERYLYIFKMANKTGSSNRSSSRAHSHSHTHTAEWIGSITLILARKTFFDHAKLKESVRK